LKAIIITQKIKTDIIQN